MALSITIIPGENWPAGSTITLARLRNTALPTIVIDGTVGTSDIAAGAITSALTRPGPHFYAAGVLTTATYAVTLSPALTSYATGSWFLFKADTDCPAGPILVNVNGLGAVTLKKRGSVDLAAKDIRAGMLVICQYDGTNLQMLNPISAIESEYVTDTGAANAYAIAPAIAITAYSQAVGKVYRFIAVNANTGASTLAISGVATPPSIKKPGNLALVAGDIVAGQILEVQFDGTNVQLLSPVQPSTVTTALGITVNPAVVVSVTSVTQVNALSDTFNITAAITASGANGLDTGAEAANTWYYLFAIYNGTTVAALLSLSSTAPTMPAGYTTKLLVGAVHNGAGSDFDHWQEMIGEKKFFSSVQTLPAADAASHIVTLSHALGGRPRFVEWVIVCTDAGGDIGFSQNDEVPLTSLLNNGGAPYEFSTGYANASNVILSYGGAAINAFRPDNSVVTNITNSKWGLKAYARRS